MILIRECNVYVYVITGVFADQLIFKSRDESFRNQLSKEWFSPLPPSNATPSTNPSKSITAVSPFSMARFLNVDLFLHFSHALCRLLLLRPHLLQFRLLL